MTVLSDTIYCGNEVISMSIWNDMAAAQLMEMANPVIMILQTAAKQIPW